MISIFFIERKLLKIACNGLFHGPRLPCERKFSPLKFKIISNNFEKGGNVKKMICQYGVVWLGMTQLGMVSGYGPPTDITNFYKFTKSKSDVTVEIIFWNVSIPIPFITLVRIPYVITGSHYLIIHLCDPYIMIDDNI